MKNYNLNDIIKCSVCNGFKYEYYKNNHYITNKDSYVCDFKKIAQNKYKEIFTKELYKQKEVK